MATFERILVATDLSAENEAMLADASPLLRRLRSVVDVAHVWHPPALSSGEASLLERDEMAFKLEHAAAVLAENGVRTGGELLVEGGTADLLRLLSERRYDLVLVGARTHYLGSVAAALQRDAPCPVLTIPSKERRHANGKPMRVLTVVDFSSCSESALDRAAELARELDTALTIMHVYSPPIYVLPDGSSFAGSTESVEAIIADTEAQLARLRYRAELHGIPVATTVVGGSPVDSILELSPEYDLIVMGTHGRSGLKRLLLGSVAEQISRRAQIPVLTIREAEADRLAPTPPAV